VTQEPWTVNVCQQITKLWDTGRGSMIWVQEKDPRSQNHNRNLGSTSLTTCRPFLGTGPTFASQIQDWHLTRVKVRKYQTSDADAARTESMDGHGIRWTKTGVLETCNTYKDKLRFNIHIRNAWMHSNLRLSHQYIVVDFKEFNRKDLHVLHLVHGRRHIFANGLTGHWTV